MTDVLHSTAMLGHAASDLAVERVDVAPGGVWDQPSHPPVVYFLANGDRVKIGVSTNIAARVSALSLRRGNALVLLQGGYELEAALHDHFQSDRIGRTEWFVLSGPIQDYVARRKEAHAVLRQPYIATEEPDADLGSVSLPAPRKKPGTAEEKVLQALEAGSARVGFQRTYIHRDQIGALANLDGSTLDNALSRLAKAGKIRRQMEHGKRIRGMYAPVPRPDEIG